jgi:hypothetical protein
MGGMGGMGVWVWHGGVVWHTKTDITRSSKHKHTARKYNSHTRYKRVSKKIRGEGREKLPFTQYVGEVQELRKSNGKGITKVRRGGAFISSLVQLLRLCLSPTEGGLEWSVRYKGH